MYSSRPLRAQRVLRPSRRLISQNKKILPFLLLCSLVLFSSFLKTFIGSLLVIFFSKYYPNHEQKLSYENILVCIFAHKHWDETSQLWEPLSSWVCAIMRQTFILQIVKQKSQRVYFVLLRYTGVSEAASAALPSAFCCTQTQNGFRQCFFLPTLYTSELAKPKDWSIYIQLPEILYDLWVEVVGMPPMHSVYIGQYDSPVSKNFCCFFWNLDSVLL